MADILINGLELPTDGHCYLGIFSDGEIRKWDNFRREFVDTEATAIELPSHGRLVDADILQAMLSKWEEDARGRDNIELAYAYKTVREIIDDRDCVVEASNG